MRQLFLFLLIVFSAQWLVGQADQPNSFGKGSTLSGNFRINPTESQQQFINPDWAPFFHGVASGDPLEDRVIIWTRVTPPELSDDPIEVQWRIARDTALSDVVNEGVFTTGPERDFTVKIDATGLAAGETYYYGFTAMGANSLTGKTKTTPTSSEVDHLKFGIVSCANYQGGYFNAYGRLADRTDLDAIIHLGDYIYEYEDFVYGSDSIWNDRLVAPSTEILSLEDYRSRYGTYRLDPDLARVHQQYPMIAVWDDHESANDAYVDGAENHTEGEEGSWEDRKAIARQVYFEWMPIRDQEEDRLYRSFRYGDLVDLIMLDTRLEGREVQINDIENPLLYAEDRTILGMAQKDWLLDQLEQSTANWKIVGQQVIFSEFNVGWAATPPATFQDTENIFLDIWDGYPAERSQIVDFIDSLSIDNVVFLTGDFHSSFAFDVADPPVNLVFQDVPGVGTLPFYLPNSDYDPSTGAGSSAIEFATPSISSANFDENLDLQVALGIQAQINNPIAITPELNLGNPNPHLKFNDLTQHGYYILDVKGDSTQANYYYTPILEVTDDEDFGAAYYSLSGENHLQQAIIASGPKEQQDIPAPTNPPANPNSAIQPLDFVPLALFPNPANEFTQLRFALHKSTRVRVSLMNQSGQLLLELQNAFLAPGMYTLRSELSDLPRGSYFLLVETDNGSRQLPLIKQ